ncbi:vacuolar protein sorting-associated protein, Vps51/Vps67 family protein [Rhizoctonia solani]|uniref:Conserved oligomeric Golgi complex subunit 1 n=1 Tax=Rhizoctonia solani TaxID=456999 RepID=A0A8H8NPH3_9AGAM|nr:vacuolar protein sorting-associated protein, Vps51/Vps67 family protein [Rhizoctonia solani]QRW15932.1 vacuolar protein sorting-associated protein, Vps51/Vps67 family protein [Rhizoctonia solani]
MIRPSRLQPPNGPILNGEDGQALVKSPGSYTSPDTTKPSLFGNGIVSGREKSVDMDYSHMDPDDMFARYSVSEIRAIRSRLLLDADGKREELRQMVGERYRDLLHASTAITNMAGTSERVVATLIDMRESCAGILLLDESPRTRHRSIPNGKTTKAQEDAHLKTLQTLSAHLKLLLDSPEHLWRWLEKKQFLHAAWLFLLARTVYRKLSKSPDEDESKKKKSEQFPVASKQWEAIGQFRPQIVHKATQALRESNTSHRVYFIYQMQDTAETLIAILLLDALSTSRTRNLFLSQRSKTLTSLLNPPVSASRRAISPNRAQNRKATAALLSPAASPRSVPSPSVQLLKTPITPSAANAKAEKKTVREVVKAFRAVISLVAGTMAATRAIYGVDGLFTQIIMDIQAEVPSQNIPTTVSQAQFPMSNIIQPSTLTSRNLTTPQILYSLPSSSLLLRFLPPSITGYTPYVSTDAEGSDETKTGNTEGESNGWLTAALEALALPARNWLNKLDSVRAVWTVRGAVVKGIVALEGTKETKDRLLGAIEAAFIGRVLEVWETRLESIEIIVSNALRRAASLSEVSTSVDAKSQDINPLTFVYSSELPIVRTEPSGDSSFRLFESALKCRVNRRTPLLDLSLSEMEAAAQELRDELTITLGDDNTSEAGTRLTSSYQPRAADACMRIADAVSKALDDAATNNEQVKAIVCVFIGRLANALAYHSNFIPNLSCSPDAATRARDIFGDVHKKSVDLWCKRSCEHALMIYRPEFEISPSRGDATSSRGSAKDTKLSQDNLSASIISSHFQKHSEDQQTVNTLIRDQLARSQLLFSTLLDVRIPQTQAKPIRTQNAFLPLGGPPTETDFHPALDLKIPV